ncbi:hypothetical protein BKA93DRAFT_777623 [Sparassis latifolia]
MPLSKVHFCGQFNCIIDGPNSAHIVSSVPCLFTWFSSLSKSCDSRQTKFRSYQGSNLTSSAVSSHCLRLRNNRNPSLQFQLQFGFRSEDVFCGLISKSTELRVLIEAAYTVSNAYIPRRTFLCLTVRRTRDGAPVKFYLPRAFQEELWRINWAASLPLSGQ